MRSLNKAPVGESLEIKWITGSRDLMKRIRELGVSEGERITVLSACFDGIIVRVRDLRLALGSDVAERIKV